MAKSISQLKKEAEALEKKARELKRVRLAKAKLDKERQLIENKIRKLKQETRSPRAVKLKQNLRQAGKKAGPILKKIKASIDEAAANY